MQAIHDAEDTLEVVKIKAEAAKKNLAQVRDHSLFLEGGLARFVINHKQNLWPPVI